MRRAHLAPALRCTRLPNAVESRGYDALARHHAVTVHAVRAHVQPSELSKDDLAQLQRAHGA
jgi:hypothetical protein